MRGARETARAAAARWRARAARALRAEDGALLIYGLFTLVIMLAAAGLAVDTMRHEHERARLQATLDRAVLAATDLDQPLEPIPVIEDYFARAGLSDALGAIDPSTGLNFKKVCAEAGRTLPTVLLRLVGIDALDAGAAACAEEQVTSVEISLVLDISGSMRDSRRLERLRTAAGEFVESVLEGKRAQRVTVSIIPYAGQVNPGPMVFDAIGGVRAHGHSSCTVLDPRDFAGTGMPVHSTEQVPNFMMWKIAPAYMDFGWCPSDAMAIRYLSNDAAALKSFIAGIRLHDGTGTQIGMKYALALLDPETNGLVRRLAAAGKASPLAESRPLPWDAPDMRKYIILMTDGQITQQFQPRHQGFVDHDADGFDNEGQDEDDVDGIDHTRLNDKVELNEQRISFVNAKGETKTIDPKSERSSAAANRADFGKVCALAKAKGVTVYTISFEAPTDVRPAMRDCATEPAYFYDVRGLQISEAFRSIAGQINELRLTR